MSTLRVGFIGAGAIHFGRNTPWDHATRLEKIGGFKVVAIVDPDTERSSDVFQERLKSPKYGHYYTDCKLLTHWEELLDLKPDAVFIGIFPAYRGSLKEGCDLELRFARAGVHVFAEKPISVEPVDKFRPYVDLVSSACKENNVVLSVGYMFRYHAAVLKMKELIKEHGGSVMAFNARYYVGYTQGSIKTWFNLDFSGGPIVEAATHFCDLARYIVGDVDLDSVSTMVLKDTDQNGTGTLAHVPNNFEEGIPPEKRIPRVTTTHWRFKNGGVGTLMHCITLPGSRFEANIDVQLDGMKLSLIEPYEKHCILRVRRLKHGKPNVNEDYTFEDDDSYFREMSTFMSAIASRDQSIIQSSYADALKTYEFTWAIRKAGEQN